MKALLFLLLISLALSLGASAFAPGEARAEAASQGGTPEAGPASGTGPEGEELPAGAGSSTVGPGDVTSIRDIRFDPHLDAQLPVDLAFRDETGKAVRLGDYIGEQPLLLSINDFSCQDVCPIELRNLVDAMNRVTFRLGADYKALAISLNPASTTEDASSMRDEVLHRYKRPDAPNGADGWHFLTGEQPAITALTEAVGLKYAYSEAAKSFAHPVGVILLTPEGRIARYLYGMDFPPNDLRLALYEASQGKISSPITPILLLCYQYDVVTGRYTNIALGLVRAAGVLTVLGLGTFLGVMFRRDIREQKGAPAAPEPNSSVAPGGETEE
jgi:protein SCO1/2